MQTITSAEAIKKIEYAESCSKEELDKLVHESLTSLVRYAKDHSPFFRELYNSIDIDNISLDELPILNKKSIQGNYENCLTDRSLTKSEIETYLNDNGYKNGLLRGEYSVLTTSGSTGEPMLMIRDSYHNIIHGALMQKRLLKSLDPNLLSPRHHRIASVICTDEHVSSYLSFLKVKAANPEYEHNLKAISVFKNLDTIINELNEFMPDVLTGYPNIIEQLALAKSNALLNIQPKMIATSAEKLSHETFMLLKKVFDAPVLNNYCSTEGGEIAMSCSQGHLHINSDWIILEPLDSDGNAVGEGVSSDKVLITDLTNYILPIIRYEIDDRVTIYNGCSCGSKLPYLEIEGRVLENIFINGKEVPTSPIAPKIESLQGILSWQLIQHDTEHIDFRCIFSDNADKNYVMESIKSILDAYLLGNKAEGIEIKISEKPFIKNSKGGKVKTVLNLISKR